MKRRAGTVVLRARGVGAVTGLLDEDVPTISGGAGAFDDVARPGRRSVVEWTGQPLRRLAFGLILDADLLERDSVDGGCLNLERMAAPVGLAGPPEVTLSAPNGRAPVPHGELSWLIESLEWGDATWQADRRTRQAAKLGLVEAQTTASRVTPANQGRGGRNRPARTRAAVPPPGGSRGLRLLAARELGSASDWPAITKLNGIRDPRTVKTGRVLRLPT